MIDTKRLRPSRIWRSARRRALNAAHALVPTNGGIPWGVIDQKRVELARRRTFGASDLEALERFVRTASAVVTTRELATMPRDSRAHVLAIRHDMDHELENSVRFAEWEAARGIRASYFVLHTDWYWGDQPDRPSGFMLRGLERIARLGHEIGVHNNAIAAALTRGGDPAEILQTAITALRREGFDVAGSVAHGDRVCHIAGFINSELFMECPDPESGPPDRTIVYIDPDTGASSEVVLQPVPMATFGLEYEAGYVGRIPYLSDTGGHWNGPPENIARVFAEGPQPVQILAHPVWWTFTGETVRPRPPTGRASGAIPTTR
jgi:hypothetical protein